MKYLLGIVLLAASLHGQPPLPTHTVTLAWVDIQNPAGATSFSVYRATGVCSGSPSFSKIASAIVARAYVDSTVTVGNYCYYVTAMSSGVESGASNQALAPVPSFAPQMLTVTVQ